MMEKRKLLVIDDTIDHIKLLKSFLDEQYDILVATNGKDGLKVAMGSMTPDLILLDIEMPEMDGFAVCEKLKTHETTRDIPIIFLTACNDAEHETKGLEMGAVDYIKKPFNRSVVEARIRTHLQLRENNLNLIKIIEQELIKQKEQDAILKRAILESKSEIIKDIAHHWRNPLNVLSLSLDLMLEKHPGEADTDHYIRMLKNGKEVRNIAYDLSNTINEYRKVFVNDTHQKEDFNIQKVVKEVLMLHEPFLDALNIIPELAINDNISFFGYKNDFLSIMYQLIKNAHEAIGASGQKAPKLHIEAMDDENRIFMIVTDNGGGVMDEIAGKIYEPYTSTKSVASGRGMGLFISKKIVEQSFGGYIAWSNVPNGVKFLFTMNKVT